MERFDPHAVREHFDSIAGRYDAGKARQSYYWENLVGIYREFVPPGSCVLDVGCGTGILLSSLLPRRGAGLDLSPEMVAAARAKYPQFEFWAEDIARPSRKDAFDYILLCDVIEHLPNPPAALEGLKSYADPRTRIVATAINPLWTGILHAAESLGLKLPEGEHEWLPLSEIRRLLDAHGYQVELVDGRILLPARIPLVSGLLNRLARLKPLKRLCLVHVVVFRLRA